MRWERRKPLWPVTAALGLLFVLALAAPRNWQGQRPSTPSQDSRQASVATAPELSLGPTVESHAVLPNNPPANSLERTTYPTEYPTEAKAKTAVTLPMAEQVESLPVRKEFNLNTLVQVRDSLLALLDQMPAIEPATKAVVEADLPSKRSPVRVSSENDRLAMLQRRELTPLRQPLPIAPRRSSAEEAADFAAVLLEAARNPKPIAKQPSTLPRLAMVPTLARAPDLALPPTPEVTTKPQEVKQPTESISRPKVTLPKATPPTIQPPALRHVPEALVEQLEGFAPGSPGAVWSQQVLAQIRRLTKEGSPAQGDALQTFTQLERLHATGALQSAELDNPSFQNQWQQTTQSLGRRLALWRVLLDADLPKKITASPTSPKLLPLLSEVAELLEAEQNGSDWREYLLIDQIADAVSEGISSPTLTRAKLAQEVLSRMSDVQLTEAQQVFLASEKLTQLQQALRPWAAGSVNLETLAALVERYESTRETRYAEVIAQLQQRLKWSENAQLQTLADHLYASYRGANMRIAMSDDLMNRMLPKQEPIVTPVRDRIAGAKVRGRARTTTQLHVRLLPDDEAWHISLQATGKVYSDTRSDTWPARIRNAAKMQYEGRKEISVNEQGVRMSPAKASARGRNELVGVDSQLDPIPIVGYLLRDMARKKHKKSRPVAITQAKAKVVRQVKQRMDSTLNEKLEVFEQKFRDKVLAPIEELALLAEPLDMHTTDDRAVMQLRLANTGQLAAHTLRPLAPSDSVLSLQMHETAFNNAMMGLGLDGRRMTMLELFGFLTDRFGIADATPPEDMPKKATIKFAKHDSVCVRCDGDRLEVILSVAELAHRRDKIKNFQIHVHFRPVLSGLNVRLVRDGSLQFSGRRLKTGPRVVLHSILGKLLLEGQEFTVVSGKLMLDPRFAGLMVTQLVIEDGWIGLALGPAHTRRTAWRAATPEVLETPFVR